jgi:hypothetical protein
VPPKQHHKCTAQVHSQQWHRNCSHYAPDDERVPFPLPDFVKESQCMVAQVLAIACGPSLAFQHIAQFQTCGDSPETQQVLAAGLQRESHSTLTPFLDGAIEIGKLRRRSTQIGEQAPQRLCAAHRYEGTQ